MKILNPQVHGWLDYAAALALIVAPFVLGLTALALWMSVAAGVGLVLYSLLTDYSASLAKLIPFRLHLLLDGLAALAFIVAPFAFGWSGVVMTYYLVMGVGVLMVVALSANEEQPEATTVAIQ